MFRYFENLVDPFQPFSDATPPKTYLAFLKTQIEPFRKIIPGLLLTGFLVAVMESGLIFYSGRVLDLMAAAGPEAFWSQHWLEICLAILFVLTICPVLIGLQHAYIELSLAGNMQDLVRYRAHRHMLGQSTGFFQNDYAGRLSNRVMQLGQATEDSFYLGFEALWYFAVYIVGTLVILGQTDWRLIIPLLVWLVVYAVYTIWIARRVGAASEKWSSARSLVTGRIVDTYTNIESVKLFAHAGREVDYARQAMRRHRLRFQRFLRLMTELSFFQNVLNGFLILGVLGPAIWLWTHDTVSIGEVAAASALVIRLNGMTGWILWVTIEMFENAGTIRESLESISVPHDVTDRPEAPALAVSRGEIRFEDVIQHYGRGSGGLDGVSLTVGPGEKVGIVGRSGAGKSSLVSALLRFHDTESGSVLIDGQDVSMVSQDSLRAEIGVVTQDSSLLHRSVRANVLYGRPDASEAQMIEAARRAEAHDFITNLVDPKGRTGYDAHVGERGVKLSGGQRQRVAIARVILKDAPILVLDEATSALDSEVEAEIQKTLYGLMKGKTVIAIAHRLSTIARMDRIIVLDDGRIAEEGSHDDLLAAGGLYASFWSRQSGGFLNVAAQ